MTPRTCARAWQAEAIEDGRLDGAERLSFEKHARSCTSCAAELASLHELRAVMELVPAPSSTPLEHRRARAALLRVANSRVLNRRGTSWLPRWGWMAAAMACAAMAILVVILVGRRYASPSIAEVARVPPTFEVDDSDGAEWTSEAAGAEIHVHLAAGQASFHVEHTRPGQRFLLQMPDGQIEVHGTRFRVAVRRGTTTLVEVSEGIVTVRVRGEPERRLHAGETWKATTGPEAIADDDGVAARASEDAGSAPDTLEPTASSPRSAGRSASDARRTQHDVFAAAVSAFRSGNYAKAEQLLDSFLEANPHDARLEDAWFMKSVARARSGDSEGAAQLARAYLERFPKGLRRREAERIAAGYPTSERP
jgi:hypothetical protein